MNDDSDRIFFDDAYVQDLERLYGRVQDRLRAMLREIAESERVLGSSPDERVFPEAFTGIFRDLHAAKNATAMLLWKIREIKNAYADAESKNIRLVRELALTHAISARGETEAKSGHSRHFTEIDRMLSGMSVGSGSLLRRNGVMHEDWLVEMAEMEQ
jgi:hypothetical protein